MLIYNESMWHFPHLKITSENYLSFLGLLSDMYLLKQPQGGVTGKNLLQKFDKKKRDK